MSPKEKAKELYDKMLQWQTDGNIYIQRNITSPSAKHSTLIAVDEILNIKGNLNFDYAWCQQKETNINNWYDTENVIPVRMHALKYWNEVKHEIEKL